nr:hypothetical protein CFP56_09957 [Quercus suber]
MQRIKLVEAALGLLGQPIPLRRQLFEVVVDVLLELPDAFRGEGMRDGLAFARVLVAVAGVEDATLDGDEGVVVFPVSTPSQKSGQPFIAFLFPSPKSPPLVLFFSVMRIDRSHNVRFQKAGAVAVDDGDRIRVSDGDLIRGDAHQRAVLLMQLMHGEVTTTSTTFVHVPEVGELGQKRSRDVLNLVVAEVWEKEVEQRGHEQQPRAKEKGKKHCFSDPLSPASCKG